MATALAVAAAVWMILPRSVVVRTPTLLGKAGAFPEAIRRAGDGAWVWIERPPQGPARLVRATPGKLDELASGEAIGGFDLADGKLAWSVRKGRLWSVVQADPQGRGPKPLWSGPAEPYGLKWVGGNLHWLRQTPTGIPFPTLAHALEVLALEPGAAAPRVVARLEEPGDGRVLGRRGTDLIVATFRRESPGSTGVWRIPSGGGAPVRLHSAMRLTEPLLAADGTLYALSPSEEGTTPLTTSVLWRVAPDGAATPVSDWLPSSGYLYESGRGVVYADRESAAILWSVRGIDALPEPIPLPPDTFGVAAGGRDLLVAAATMGSRNTPTLYEVPRP